MYKFFQTLVIRRQQVYNKTQNAPGGFTVRNLMLAICLILLNTMPIAACDVSLFALVAGNSPNKAFATTLTGLVTCVKLLGNNSQNKETMPGHLQQFMVKWIEFSNSFQQNPPEWAKKDPDWKAKFEGLTDLIGSIRKNLTSNEPNYQKSHSEIQKFSRQLTRLYDSLPMDSQSRLLLDITMQFDYIWDAWNTQNQLLLIETTQKISSSTQQLSGQFDEKAREQVEEMMHRSSELHKMASKDTVFAGKSFEFMLNMAENDFARFNDARKNNAPSTEK